MRTLAVISRVGDSCRAVVYVGRQEVAHEEGSVEWVLSCLQQVGLAGAFPTLVPGVVGGSPDRGRWAGP